jgi:shikimate dehydrogenase
VTIPHKHNLLQYVERHGGHIEPLTARIGAANTLHVETGADGSTEVSAYNTDYLGVLGALCAGMDCEPEALKGKSAAVLGAGGVCRAIVAGLRDSGCDVTIYNRTQSKADALAAEFGAIALPAGEKANLKADIVVNGTSIGMHPDVGETPLPAEGMNHQPVVFDTIYNPIETRLLREARERGCRTVDGVAMFVRQAAAQFERWLGRPAPVDIMRDVVLRRLSQ